MPKATSKPFLSFRYALGTGVATFSITWMSSHEGWVGVAGLVALHTIGLVVQARVRDE